MGQIPNDDEVHEAFPRWVIIVSIILLLAVVSFIAYGARNPDTFKDLGTLGDFVGGTLNPILTFATFIGLLYTIHLQKHELRLTRNELILTRQEFERSSNALEAQNLTTKQQRFENTLFSMIEMLNQIVNAMYVVVSKEVRIEGQYCFNYFLTDMYKTYRDTKWPGAPRSFEYNYETRTQKRIEHPHNEQRLLDAADHFFKQYQYALGHYFRVLYNIFRYIDQSEFADGIYPKILRAQLSNQELLSIFYNNATERGKAFAALAERFELYDYMDTERLLRPEHIDLASKKSFGKNPMTLPEEREHPN